LTCVPIDEVVMNTDASMDIASRAEAKCFDRKNIFRRTCNEAKAFFEDFKPLILFLLKETVPHKV